VLKAFFLEEKSWLKLFETLRSKGSKQKLFVFQVRFNPSYSSARKDSRIVDDDSIVNDDIVERKPSFSSSTPASPWRRPDRQDRTKSEALVENVRAEMEDSDSPEEELAPLAPLATAD